MRSFDNQNSRIKNVDKSLIEKAYNPKSKSHLYLNKSMVGTKIVPKQKKSKTLSSQKQNSKKRVSSSTTAKQNLKINDEILVEDQNDHLTSTLGSFTINQRTQRENFPKNSNDKLQIEVARKVSFASTNRPLSEDQRLFGFLCLKKYFLRLKRETLQKKQLMNRIVELRNLSIVRKSFHQIQVHKNKKMKARKIMVKSFVFFKVRLLTKSVYAWKKVVIERSRIKKFVIRRLARQKMASKLLVFTFLKQERQRLKNLEVKWAISVGFNTKNLLKRSMAQLSEYSSSK